VGTSWWGARQEKLLPKGERDKDIIQYRTSGWGAIILSSLAERETSRSGMLRDLPESTTKDNGKEGGETS